MKEKTIHHLVHVGFDVAPQPKLVENIKKRILDLVDHEGRLINFVDEYNNKIDEYEERKKTTIAQEIAHYVRFLQNKITHYPAFDMIFVQKTFEGLISKKTRDYCSKHVYNHPKLSAVYKLKDGNPETFMETYNKIHEVFSGFMENGFQKLLDHAINELYHNPYGYDNKGNHSIKKAKNRDRREELYDFAVKKLGKKRVTISGMNDGDLSHLGRYNEKSLKKYLDEKVKLERMRLAGKEYIRIEEEFGEAEPFIRTLQMNLINKRVKKFKTMVIKDLGKNDINYYFTKSISLKDFNPLTSNIRHVVGGEYYGRCVQAYGLLLHNRGAPKHTIKIDKSISLIKAKDNY